MTPGPGSAGTSSDSSFKPCKLVEVLSVEENLRLPATLAGLPDDETREQIDHLLDVVGLRARRQTTRSTLGRGASTRRHRSSARALIDRLLDTT